MSKLSDLIHLANSGGCKSKGIIGEDNSCEVTDTSEYPYCCIARLEIKTASNQTDWGTGFFISPHCVITAAHNVYNGGQAQNIAVIPGAKGRSEPYGRQYTDDFLWTKEWRLGKGWQYDFGAIILPDDTLFTNIKKRYFGYKIHEPSDVDVELAGYPVAQEERRGAKPYKEGHQRFSTGRIRSYDDRFLYYADTLDTMPGHSGSPVFVEEGKQRYVVGIHHYFLEDGTQNRAILLNESVMEHLYEWSQT